MNTLKLIFLSLGLVLMAAAAPLSAMNEDSERLAMEQQLVASTCAQSLWNTLAAVKSVAYYSVSFVAPEARCLPDVINDVLLHMAPHQNDEVKDQNTVELKNNNRLKADGTISNGVHTILSAIKNRAIDGVSYAHNVVTGGAIYAHDAINDVLTYIAADDQ